MVYFESDSNVIADREIGVTRKQSQHCRTCFEPNRVEDFSTLEGFTHYLTSN